MDKIKNKLAERLILLRKQRNLSQYKLAELLGFSRGLISNYEQGRREPDYNTLLAFALFYHVSVDYLLGLTDEENSTYGNDGELLDEIKKLRPESREELNRYIELLKIRDTLPNGSVRKSSVLKKLD